MSSQESNLLTFKEKKFYLSKTEMEESIYGKSVSQIAKDYSNILMEIKEIILNLIKTSMIDVDLKSQTKALVEEGTTEFIAYLNINMTRDVEIFIRFITETIAIDVPF